MANEKPLSWQETPLRKTSAALQPAEVFGAGQPKFVKNFLGKIDNAALDYLEPVSTPRYTPDVGGPVYGSYDDLVQKGWVKPKYAKGGSVSSRADGCCRRGRTKGRFV